MKIKVIVGILISILCLFIAFSKVNFSEFQNALLEANYFYFVLAMSMSMIIYLTRAYRWKYLLILQKDIKYSTVFSATSIGFFANNVLPMRAGEFIRAYVIAKNEKIPASSVLATILVERIVDVLSLLFIAAAALFFLPIPRNQDYENMKLLGIILFGLEGFILIFCFMLILKKEFTLGLASKVLSLFPKRIQELGSKIIASFQEGLEILRAVEHFFKIGWTSLVIWVIYFFQIYIMLLAFGISLDLSLMLMASVVVLIFSALSVTIPSAPGFVGPFHAAVQKALTIFSVDASLALGFAALLHLSSYIPITIIGFGYFTKENVKLAAIKEQKAEETSPE